MNSAYSSVYDIACCSSQEASNMYAYQKPMRWVGKKYPLETVCVWQGFSK